MSAFYFVKLPGELSTLAPYLIAGAVVAGVVAVMKAKFRPSAWRVRRDSSTFLSLIEDLVAIVGGLLGAFYAPLAPSLTPALLTTSLLFLLVASLLFSYRIRNSVYQPE